MAWYQSQAYVFVKSLFNFSPSISFVAAVGDIGNYALTKFVHSHVLFSLPTFAHPVFSCLFPVRVPGSGVPSLD